MQFAHASTVIMAFPRKTRNKAADFVKAIFGRNTYDETALFDEFPTKEPQVLREFRFFNVLKDVGSNNYIETVVRQSRIEVAG